MNCERHEINLLSLLISCSLLECLPFLTSPLVEHLPRVQVETVLGSPAVWKPSPRLTTTLDAAACSSFGYIRGPAQDPGLSLPAQLGVVLLGVRLPWCLCLSSPLAPQDLIPAL